MDGNELRERVAIAVGWRWVLDPVLTKSYWFMPPSRFEQYRADWLNTDGNVVTKIPEGSREAGVCGSSASPPLLPHYDNDLNACRELRALLKTPGERMRYLNKLRDQVSEKCPRNKVGTPLVSDFDLIDASAEQHCIAFLFAKGVKYV